MVLLDQQVREEKLGYKDLKVQVDSPVKEEKMEHQDHKALEENWALKVHLDKQVLLVNLDLVVKLECQAQEDREENQDLPAHQEMQDNVVSQELQEPLDKPVLKAMEVHPDLLDRGGNKVPEESQEQRVIPEDKGSVENQVNQDRLVH